MEISKNNNYLKLLLLAILGSLVSTSTFAGQRAYQLVCRGGGQMSADTVFDNGQAGRVDTWIRFKGAAVAATTKPVRAGECAWTDRGFRKGEPTMLAFSGKVSSFEMMITPGSKIVVGGQGSSHPVRGSSDLKALLGAVSSGKQFYVHVYQERKQGREAVLRITHVGP